VEAFPELETNLGRMFDNNGRLRDDATPDIARARRELRASEQRLLRLVEKLTTELHERGLLQDRFSTIRNGRPVLPVKAGARSRVGGILHGTSATGETYYLEPGEVVEAGNAIEIVREEERREVLRILRDLTTQLRIFVPFAQENLRVFRELDGFLAIARTAVDRGWHLPVVVEKGPFRLFNAHHPLLNLRGGKSVPLTMLLDRDDRCIVFSGPNAGGKTTAMKALGLLALLTQCGVPIPAFPDSQIPAFGNVLADIGDRQDLSEGVSTFSGHVRRIRELWDQATPRSLVLMDELGTGTDPQEGSPLALATLDAFRGRAALTLTTSHLDPVKVWAEDTPGVRNASFSLDPATREPTFTLRLDIPGASEALEIAEREGMPRTILERARSMVDKRHLEMGELLRRIEERERSLSISVRDAEARAKSLGEQEQIARARADSLRRERREFREASLLERQKAVAEIRERMESMIADLPGEDELRRRKELLAKARTEALRQERIFGSERQLIKGEHAVGAGNLRVGGRVFVSALGQWGEIVRIDAGGAQAKVSVGQLELAVKVEDLLDHNPRERREEERLLAEDIELHGVTDKRRQKRSRKIKHALRNAQELNIAPGPPRVTFAGRSVNLPSRPTSMTLDLHGFRVEEAVAELDIFIDRSLLASFPHVKINHGIGTGRLYKAVHEYLRQNRSVKSYRFATPDEGGGGVTVVEL